MDPNPAPAPPSRLADSLARSLVWINAAAAAMLLAALLVAALWQDAAMDFVSCIAIGLGLHGAGVLAGVCVHAFRYLRARDVAPRACGYLAVIACAISAACFAAGLAVLVWGGLALLGGDSGYDTESHSVPLGWTRT